MTHILQTAANVANVEKDDRAERRYGVRIHVRVGLDRTKATVGGLVSQ